MLRTLKKLLRDEEGQALVEYGLLLGLIAAGLVALIFAMRGHLVTIFTNVQDALGQGAAGQ